MHRTQLWTVFGPAPVSVGTWASRTSHNYRVAGSSPSHQGLLALHFRVWFPELGQGPLHWQIGLDVAVRCSRTLMAEPESNHAEGDTGLKPMHCWRGEVVLSGSLQSPEMGETTSRHRRNYAQSNRSLSRQNPSKTNIRGRPEPVHCT